MRIIEDHLDAAGLDLNAKDALHALKSIQHESPIKLSNLGLLAHGADINESVEAEEPSPERSSMLFGRLAWMEPTLSICLAAPA